MKPIYRILFLFLMGSLAMPASSQNNDSTIKRDKKIESDTKENQDRAAGLKKLTNNAHRWDHFDLDNEAIEANIELAIEKAMKNVSVALGNLDLRLDNIKVNIPEIEIDPIDIDIPEIEIPEIEIPEMDMNIEPIDIHIDGMDVDHEKLHRRHHWYDYEEKDEVVNDDDQDKNKDKDKNKLKEKDKNEKDKSGKDVKDKEKDKTKGLKKVQN